MVVCRRGQRVIPSVSEFRRRRRESTGENLQTLFENRCDTVISAGEHAYATPGTGTENDMINPLPVNDVHLSSTWSTRKLVAVSINEVGFSDCPAPCRMRVVCTAGNGIAEALLTFRGAIVSFSRAKERRYRPSPGAPRQGE